MSANCSHFSSFQCVSPGWLLSSLGVTINQCLVALNDWIQCSLLTVFSPKYSQLTDHHSSSLKMRYGVCFMSLMHHLCFMSSIAELYWLIDSSTYQSGGYPEKQCLSSWDPYVTLCYYEHTETQLYACFILCEEIQYIYHIMMVTLQMFSTDIT